MKTVICTVVLAALALAYAPNLWAQTLVPIAVNGPIESRVNIVLTGDGFDENEVNSGVFGKKAEWVAKKMAEFPPLSEYSNFINFFSLPVISKDSGISHPWKGINKDTFYGLLFDYSKIAPDLERLIPGGDNSNLSYRKASDTVRQYLSDYDAIIILVNDSPRAGIGSIGPGWENPYDLGVAAVSGDSISLWLGSVHEYGHVEAKLQDERIVAWQNVDIPTTIPNVTSSLTHIPWQVWIEPGTPVPIKWGTWPDDETVSAFTKGYSLNGYSPQQNCIMRSGGYRKFCKICTEAMIKAWYRVVYPIQDWSPRNLGVTLSGGEIQTFSVETIQPKTHNLIVRAAVDGVELLISGHSIALSGAQLGDGVHQVVLTAIDTTSAVRNDPQKLLTDQKIWTVTVSGADPGGVLPYPIVADFNGDGQVGFTDFFMFVDAFNKSKGEAGFDARVNLNRDRRIDFEDFFLFAFSFGKRGLAPSGRELFSTFYREGYESAAPSPDRSKKPASR